MVVGLVEKPDKSVDLVSGFLAEAAYGLKGLFRGDRGFCSRSRALAFKTVTNTTNHNACQT
jgi:hypothetical protein